MEAPTSIILSADFLLYCRKIYLLNAAILDINPNSANFPQKAISPFQSDGKRGLRCLGFAPELPFPSIAFARKINNLHPTGIVGARNQRPSNFIGITNSCTKSRFDEITLANIHSSTRKIRYPNSGIDFLPPGVEVKPVLLHRNRPIYPAQRAKCAFKSDYCEIPGQDPNDPFKAPTLRMNFGRDPIDPAESTAQLFFPTVLEFVVSPVEMVRVQETHLRKTAQIESSPERSPPRAA